MRKLALLLLFFGLSAAVAADDAHPLPDTEPLDAADDLSMQNLARVDRYLLQQINASPEKRAAFWNRDFSSPEAYRRSVQANRERLRRLIGAVDERRAPRDLQLVATLGTPSLIAETTKFRILAVKWSVCDGFEAEGRLYEPTGNPGALVVAVRDAYGTGGSFLGQRLAEAGCRVLVPMLIARESKFAGDPGVRMLPYQTDREFVYRQAFFMGRHLIGYEVQKVLAAVDYFEHWSKQTGRDLPIGVAGHGEGGLLAFYSDALDERIDAAWVSGYFRPREQLHREPVDRNVYGLLREFGDAEIASLVAPRSLIIEDRWLEWANAPPKGSHFSAHGELTIPPREAVRNEFGRARDLYRKLDAGGKITLVEPRDRVAAAGSTAAGRAFLTALGLDPELLPPANQEISDQRKEFNHTAQRKRQFHQLVSHTQEIARRSHFERENFWSQADDSSVEKWQQTTGRYRDVLWGRHYRTAPQGRSAA